MTDASGPQKRKRMEEEPSDNEEDEEEEKEEEEEEEECEEDEECESSSDSGSGDPGTLVIDKDGRVEFGGSLGDVSETAVVWDSVVSPSLVKRCQEWCKAAAVQAKVKKGRAYSRGSTFWVGCGDTPRCLPEAVAQAIFKQHTRGTTYDAKRSGAEWWTLVLDQDSEVGWHWDKDYALEEPLQMNVYPHVATVTYLSDWGAPTFVAHSIAPPAISDVVPPTLDTYHFTYPRIGRHMAFDGRFLHGSKGVGHREVPVGESRVTMLVNIWLNHRPITTKRFKAGADDVAPTDPVSLDFTGRVEPKVHPPASAGRYNIPFTAAGGRTLSVALAQPPCGKFGCDVKPATFTVHQTTTAECSVGNVVETQPRKKRKIE